MSKLEVIGDGLITWAEYFKAATIFSPLSRIMSCCGERYHDKVSKRRVKAGSFLVRISPNISIDFLWQIATLAESVGDEKRFQLLMKRALKVANNIERDLETRPMLLFALVHFYLRLLDFNSAFRVIDKMNSISPFEARTLRTKVESVVNECDSWRPALDAAYLEFSTRLAGEPVTGNDNAVNVFIPANAFSLKPLGYVGFLEDLRQVFRIVFEILESKQSPYRPRLRLATHGKVRDETNAYISYHSVSDGLNGLHIKETERRGYFSIDRGGYSGWSEFRNLHCGVAIEGVTRKEIDDFVNEERLEVIQTNASKYDQPKSSCDHLPQRYVFVALQVMDDAVQRLSHVHMFDMLEDICRHCAKIGIGVVVKRHPKCMAPAMSIALKRGLKRKWFISSDGSIHDLIQGAMAVCVVNSSVGAEALLHGKPVYCFGEAEYKAACFQVKKRGDFGPLFRHDALPVPSQKLVGMIYSLRHVYSSCLSDSNNFRKHLERATEMLGTVSKFGTG